MSKLKDYEYFYKIRKPIPPPDKEIRPRKEKTREKNMIRDLINEGIEEYEREKENN